MNDEEFFADLQSMVRVDRHKPLIPSGACCVVRPGDQMHDRGSVTPDAAEHAVWDR